MLPAYSEDMLPVLLRKPTPGLKLGQYRPEYAIGDFVAPIATYDEVMEIRDRGLWIGDEIVRLAAVGYIGDVRKFNYGPTKEKEAAEIVLHMDKGQFSAVRWPDRRTGTLSAKFKGDLKGAIAVIIYSKYSESKPFVIDELEIIQPVLDLSVEASPEPE